MLAISLCRVNTCWVNDNAYSVSSHTDTISDNDDDNVMLMENISELLARRTNGQRVIDSREVGCNGSLNRLTLVVTDASQILCFLILWSVKVEVNMQASLTFESLMVRADKGERCERVD